MAKNSSPPQLSSSEEDYLLAMLRNNAPARTSQLARALSVADPSVTAMVTRLTTKGLAQRMPKKRVDLTKTGKDIALKLLRRHRMIELFLTAVLGYEWHEVHEEANRLEHQVSDKFIDRLEVLLGNPEFDPHGAPIPPRQGRLTPRVQQRLSEVAQGKTVRITEVDDGNPELLVYLGEKGLYPGVELRVADIEPFDGPMVLQVSNRPVAIGKDTAGIIFVGVADEEGESLQL